MELSGAEAPKRTSARPFLSRANEALSHDPLRTGSGTELKSTLQVAASIAISPVAVTPSSRTGKYTVGAPAGGVPTVGAPSISPGERTDHWVAPVAASSL